MTRDKFNSIYNPANKCYALYQAPNGDRLSGLLLDGLQTGLVIGMAYVQVDNFPNTVNLANVLEVIDSGEAWC